MEIAAAQGRGADPHHHLVATGLGTGASSTMAWRWPGSRTRCIVLVLIAPPVHFLCHVVGYAAAPMIVGRTPRRPALPVLVRRWARQP
jgi:hypothetical protein